MKFRLRALFLAFFTCFLLVGTLSIVSYNQLSQLNERVNMVERSYKVTNLISLLDNNVRELDKVYFRYLITDKDSFRYRFGLLSVSLSRLTDSLKSLSRDNGTPKDLIILFQSDMNLYQRVVANTFRAATGTADSAAWKYYDESKYLIEAAVISLHRMTAAEERLLSKHNAERITYGQLTGDMIKALSIVFGVITLVLFFFLLKEFRTRVLFQKQLQQKMAELAQSKNELEHIAYASSHDLQEPLRKIQILTDRLKIQQKTAGPDTEDTIERLIAAAARMQELVSDLMVLTSLTDGEATVLCPMNNFVRNVIASINENFPEANAEFHVESLPEIEGHPDQLRLLFKNLLENAVKFSRPGINPVIHISLNRSTGDELGESMNAGHEYYCITVRDNGVGFDNKMAVKMFGIFRQLHDKKEGFTGKGTGLAICHRIMSNHKGRITAHGFPDAGATFKLYFPVHKG